MTFKALHYQCAILEAYNSETSNFPLCVKNHARVYWPRSRPVKSTENYFAQIWNQRFKAKEFEPATCNFYGRKKSFRGVKDKVIMLL